MTHPIVRPFIDPANVGFNLSPEQARAVSHYGQQLVEQLARSLASDSDARFAWAAHHIRETSWTTHAGLAREAGPLPDETVARATATLDQTIKLVAAVARGLGSEDRFAFTLPVALIGGFGGGGSWASVEGEALEAWASAREALSEAQAVASGLRRLLESFGMPTLEDFCEELRALETA